MTRIFTFLFLTLLTCFQVAKADVTVTFNVNMDHMIVNGSGVFVAGGTIGAPGTNELTDPDNDGIYSGSVTVPDNAFVYYIFTNGNCGDYSCKERMTGQSCSDPANFDDRSFQAGTTDMTINTCFGVCSTTTSCASVDVTFEVNMSNETVSPDGVFLAGGLGFGQPGDIPMLDSDNDGTYSVTRTLPTDYRDFYTFTNGNCPGDFNCKEQIGGQICASAANFNDRLIVVGPANETISTCFGLCTDDGTCDVPMYSVTFQVDMSNETVNPGGVFMGSNIDGWSGNIPMSDTDGDGIYTYTTDLLSGAYEYKFINGPGFCCAEFVPIACDVTGGAFQNRGVSVINQDVVIPAVCFSSCSEECITLVDVTFQVDMSNVDTNPAGVFMGAAFDGWSGNIAMMDPDGDDVWEYTAQLPPSATNYEYKYINGPGFCCQEFVPDDCNVVLGSGFQNRGVMVPDNGITELVIPAVCYNSCVTCSEFVDVHFRVDMGFEDVNPGGIFMGSNIDGWSGNIAMSQVGNSSVWEVVINLSPGSYEYKFINGPGFCCAESVPLACDVTGGALQNRGVTVVSTGGSDMYLPAVCFSSCDDCPKVGCMNPEAHNYSSRAEIQLGMDSQTFYWDDVALVTANTSSPYCDTEVTHFAGDPGSEVNLTINTVDANTMEVIVKSVDDANPVDELIVPGGSGATISDIDNSVPGQLKRTLTWANPPVDVALNVLWSVASFGGNWQLSQGDVFIPFGANCTPTNTPPNVLADFEAPTNLTDFGNAFSSIIVDPTDGGNMVVETNKVVPATFFAGTLTDLDVSIPFTIANTKLSVRVWSPLANIPVLLKLENTAGGPTTEVSVNTTTSMQWETLEYDFSNDPAFNVANTYNRVVIFFDFGTEYNGSECETCDDGVQNGDEEGIDCGGTNGFCVPCNEGCTDPDAHNYDDSAVVDNGSCQTCSDGEQNGDETGKDCGGALCTPCNDDCSGAFNVKCGETVTGSTINTTDTDPGLDCGDVSNPAEGVWYKFQGTGAEITLSTDNLGTDYDTNLQVFTGNCNSLTCVDGNEDVDADAFNFNSKLIVPTTPGTAYYIHVSGWNGSQGNYEMTVDCYTPVKIIVKSIHGIPTNGVGTGSIGINIAGGDTNCGPLTYSWEGPNGFTATTEDISGLTVAGEYVLTVTDCTGAEVSTSVTVPTRTRGRGRRGKTVFVEDAIFQASPNPFGQVTFINFNLSVEEQVSLNIYDITGKQVASLFNDTAKAETNYQFQFGNDLPTGTYIAALTTASGETKHIKLILTH